VKSDSFFSVKGSRADAGFRGDLVADNAQNTHILPTTKLKRPTADSNWVVRPRLISRLDEGRKKRLTLIPAPAGYGKTTLVAQWFDQIPEHAAWLSLDKNDGDPDRFLSYFIAAVSRVFSGFGSEIESLLSSPELAPPDYLADTLISELDALKKPLVVVFDDFHAIVSEPVQMMLTRAVQYLPEHIHLVISTRMDPPLPLAHWRVRSWFLKFRAADLRFSKEEAQDFFLQSLKKPLSVETIDLLQRQTEGWVTGLQLARLSLTDAENPDQYARSFSGRNANIVDFLLEEVVAKQPAEIKNFLAVTAVFDRFCASLCDFILGSKSGIYNSRRLIARLERENLFLVPLGSDRRWYRYHHLFQNLLMQHLKENTSAEQKIEIHRRAGKWFAEQGLIEEALQHFLAAGEVKKAAELVELNLDDTLEKDFSRRALRRWLDMFPKSAEKQQPALLVARVLCATIHWDFYGMALLMDDAEALLRSPACKIPKSRRQKLLNIIDAHRGFYLYWNGDTEGALKHALQALNNTPKKYRHLNYLAVMYAGAAYAMNGLPDEGMQLLNDAIAKARSTDSSYAGAYLTVQAGIFYYVGSLAAVKQTAEQILELYKIEAVDDYWFCHAHYFLGSAAYERNRLDTAVVHFQCVEQMRYLTNARPYHDSLIGLALVALARGDAAAAREYALSARSFAIEMNDAYSLKISDSLATRLAIVAGEVAAESTPLAPTVDSTHLWLESPALTHVEYLLSKGSAVDCSAALEYVANAKKEVRQHHNTRQLIQLQAVEAVALKSAGRLADALQTLEESLRMAEPLGFVRTFVDRGPLMAELLTDFSAKRPDNRYIGSLLKAFGAELPTESTAASSVDRRHPGEQHADPFLASGLSNRELDVLDLLEKRLTNKEIAERLFISPQTIKKHTSNIYSKLNVTGRRQAVAAARKIGILNAK